MQTFLPFKSFIESAKSLDIKRLGKQRAECKQIITAIYIPELLGNIFLAQAADIDITLLQGSGYKRIRNHPATLMWENYPVALIAYSLVICQEFKDRGNDDNTFDKINAFTDLFSADIYADQEWLEVNCPEILPPWLGDSRLHKSHRSNLIRKLPGWYRGVLGWSDDDNLEYFWPGNDYQKEVAL